MVIYILLLISASEKVTMCSLKYLSRIAKIIVEEQQCHDHVVSIINYCYKTHWFLEKCFKKMWNYSCCGIFSALQFMKLRLGLNYNAPIKKSFIAISVCYREECGLTVVQISSRRKSLKWTIGIVINDIWNYLWLWSVLSGSQSRGFEPSICLGVATGDV